MGFDNFQESKLDSGVLVLSHGMPAAQTVALGIFIDVGSRDELSHVAGIAHALEHMMFKGTTHLDVHKLSQRLDNLGGNANAYTSRERTCFHLQVLHEDWQEALKLLLDMVQNPAIPDEEWQREREVILSEMAMVEDTPDEWMFDQHMQAMFPDSAFGASTLGTRESILSMHVDDLRDYLHQHYQPPRLLVSAAGRIEHAELVDLLQAYPWKGKSVALVRECPIAATGVQYLERSTEQVQIALSWPGISAASAERPLAWVANQLLGVGMSSSLFREVREKRGLVYGIGSHLSTYTDLGIWSVSCATDPKLLAPCLQVLQETLTGYVDELSDELLMRAKRQLEVQLRMGMDSVEGYMLYLSGRFDEPVLHSQAYWVALIQEVTVIDLRVWVAKHLAAEPMWTLLGPKKALQSARNIL
ncbi:MAG: insulinase family protein [Zetaproteobacteria bacterium]|nr:insulinase family protein [Zetaproteobacteria bacterium]